MSQISLPWQEGLVAVEFAWRHAIAQPRKPPAIRKDLGDISCISRVIADFVPNFVAMATGVCRSRICLASFNSPSPKTPCYTQRSQGYLLYKPSYSRFCPKISLPWQRGLVAVEFAWRRSKARPQKPPAIRKDLSDISYISRVIADFVSNFVAMATGVGCSRICLASCYSPTPKTPCYAQRSQGYLLYKPSYSRFCPKFRCHGNGGWSQ